MNCTGWECNVLDDGRCGALYRAAPYEKILPDLEDLTGYIGKCPLPGGSLYSLLNKKDLTGFEYPTFGVQCKPVRSGV
jgi:hypothetical protein